MDIKAKRILLVEDEKFVADLLREAMTREGLTVDIVHDGIEVIPLAQQTLYHLILLDIGLPNKDGMVLLEELRQLDAYKYCPIVMLTNYADLDRIHKSRQLGATDYLIKSQIDYSNIKQLIGKYL